MYRTCIRLSSRHSDLLIRSRQLPGALSSVAMNATAEPHCSSANAMMHTSFRSFHLSTSLSLPARRRRRGRSALDPSTSIPLSPSESKDEHGKTQTTPTRVAVTDADVFQTQAKLLLDEIHTALSPLKAKNDIFVLKRGQEPSVGPNLLLDLGPIEGMHTMQMDSNRLLLMYTTPISGVFNYYLIEEQHPETHVMELTWRSSGDGHEFKGLLVRDLLKAVNGCPKL